MNERTKKRTTKMARTIAVSALVMALTALTSEAGPKYIFFFLGDGMANAQIQTTEAYRAVAAGMTETNPVHLTINQLLMHSAAVCGMQTTYDDGALCTDSASSATAFACGTKTKSGVIGMNSAKTVSYYSVAHAAAALGMKVGVISSVSLDHATPAAYYANVPNRNYMNNIAYQLTRSGFNFFGGGGFASPTGPKTSGDTSHNIWNELSAMGYTVLSNRTAIMNLSSAPMDKVVCINAVLDNSKAMPYAIDRPAENLSLAEMTAVAIDCLKGDPNGFFLMVEGGKIDWACHANDAVAAIGDMIDFDNAIAAAAAFMALHPEETLVIATGDHETGGMTVGHTRLGYGANYSVLLAQTHSYEHFQANEWAAYKTAHSPGFDPATGNVSGCSVAQGLLSSCFGLVWANLNAWEQERLEDAYDKALGGYSANSPEEDTIRYGYYEPFVVTITHILNERAGIGWTSYMHTGVPVPVMAHGPESERFEGFYDNTDIAQKIVELMGFVGVDLPVSK